jgi:cob(I)alamin adenosyltransferase
MEKIYTKTGDHGTTQLADGTRVAKNSERIEACGCIDELNSFLGLTRAYIGEETAGGTLIKRILRIQQELIIINSQLALASDTKNITMSHVKTLEQEIDDISAKLPPIDKFLIPGDTVVVAVLHVTRTVCRRAERAVTKLDEDIILPYLNRLSDWLFVAACFMENMNEKKQ